MNKLKIFFEFEIIQLIKMENKKILLKQTSVKLYKIKDCNTVALNGMYGVIELEDTSS